MSLGALVYALLVTRRKASNREFNHMAERNWWPICHSDLKDYRSYTKGLAIWHFCSPLAPT